MSTIGLGLDKGAEFNPTRPMKVRMQHYEFLHFCMRGWPVYVIVHCSQVLIAGGGIGGLILGKALESKGIDYLVFEKAKEYKPFGGPIQVQSNALSCLEAINKEMCEVRRFTVTEAGRLKCRCRKSWLQERKLEIASMD
jgi:hypothetical protein